MKIKKISILILFFVLNFLLANEVLATTLTFEFSKNSVGVGEQFYVDLMLDPDGQSVNTISGSLIFPNDNISFVRLEEGKSMIDLWIEKPKLNNDRNTINFSGLMTHGFDGVIDPFNINQKLPGLIVRLVFKAQRPGLINFSTSAFSLNLNDGLGTEIKALPINKELDISNSPNQSKYENPTSGTPELEAYITRDPDIFNNKYILIFNATDKETGIKSVMIKEGQRNWAEIESPYLLKDQSRHSMINLQATNYNGAGIIINIDKMPYDWLLIIKLLIIGIITVVSIFVTRKIYQHKIKIKA